MSEKTAKAAEKVPQGSARARLLGLLPGIIFVIVLAAAAAFAMNQQQEVRRQVAQRQEKNESLGLPRDYPLELFPLYPDLSIVETERGTGEASDGARLNKWVIKGDSPTSEQEIFSYYNTMFLDRGMRQTMYISMPGGIAVNFGDENNIAEFEIERREGMEQTSVKMTVYTPFDKTT